MCSGQDSYQTCEVWGRSDIVCLSYNNFLFHGETSKFVRLPWTRPSTKTQDLRNLTSQRALDYTSRFSTVGPVRASALNGPGGANSLGPVAPSPKSRCISTVGPEAPQRFTKTRPLHASLEQRHTTPSFHQQREVIRKQIRNKSLELARS